MPTMMRAATRSSGRHDHEDDFYSRDDPWHRDQRTGVGAKLRLLQSRKCEQGSLQKRGDRDHENNSQSRIESNASDKRFDGKSHYFEHDQDNHGTKLRLLKGWKRQQNGVQDGHFFGEPKGPDDHNRRHLRLHQILQPDAGSLPQSERVNQNQRFHCGTLFWSDDQANCHPKKDHHVNVANSQFRRSERVRSVQGWKLQPFEGSHRGMLAPWRRSKVALN